MPVSPPTPAPHPNAPAGTARPDADAGPVDPEADRLLRAARQGSNRAWAGLLERLDPTCRLLAHLVLGGHDVDTTLESAYVRAYRARRKGSDDAAELLLNHVWMACGHEIRRRQRREAPAPGRRAQRDDRTLRFGPGAEAAAVADLRPEERAVWGLVHQAQLPVASVAGALGVDRSVVAGVADRVVDLVEEAVAAGDQGAAEVAPTDDQDDLDRVDGSPSLDEPTQAHSLVDDDAEGDGTDPDGLTVITEGGDGDETGGPDETGSLEPPPATPVFWAELGRRLLAERDAVAAAPPPPPIDPDGGSPALSRTPAPPVAMQRRAPRRSRRHRPDLVEGLAEEAGRQRPRRSWPALLLRVLVVLVVLGILAGAVVALYNAASTARSPVRGDSTADVSRRSMGVLAEAGSWSATIERTEVQDGETTVATLEVVTAEDGSYRISDDSISRLTTYDARFAMVRDTIPGFPSRNDQGVAPGGPDPSPPRAGLPIGDLATAARVLSTQDDTEPETTELNGREVQTLTGPLDADTELTYTVDAARLLPVRITWTRGDVKVKELRFRDIQLGVGATPYSQELPPDAPPAVDLGFLPVQLGEVQARTGQTPLTPDYLPGQPDGFAFTGAFVNEGERVVSLRYAAGPQQVIITVRPSPVEAGQQWPDPFDRADETVTPEDVTLDSGPFRDAPVQMVAGGTALPSIWGSDGERAFTVAGDLSAQDLQRVAASLG